MTTYDGTTNLQTAIAALCGCSIKSQATIAKLIKQAKESLGITGKCRLSPQNNLAVYQWHYDRLNIIATSVELVEPVEKPCDDDEHTPIEQVETSPQANNKPVEIMQRLPDNAMFKFAFYTNTYNVRNRQVIGLHGCYVNALLLATGIDKKGIPVWIQSAVLLMHRVTVRVVK